MRTMYPRHDPTLVADYATLGPAAKLRVNAFFATPLERASSSDRSLASIDGISRSSQQCQRVHGALSRPHHYPSHARPPGGQEAERAPHFALFVRITVADQSCLHPSINFSSPDWTPADYPDLPLEDHSLDIDMVSELSLAARAGVDGVTCGKLQRILEGEDSDSESGGKNSEGAIPRSEVLVGCSTTTSIPAAYY